MVDRPRPPASAPTITDTAVATGTPPRPELRVDGGETGRLGRYQVLGPLGAGGMGVVHRAHNPELNREVALKLLKVGTSAAGRERLLREAQALAQVAHPNVVNVFDVGVERDQVYVAMELVRGRTLKEWLQEAPRGPAEILARFHAAGVGLAAAHAAGLVHRDFKPSNVMVGDDGRVRVLDFGLARTAGEARAAEAPEAPVAATAVSPSGAGLTSSSDRLAAPITQAGSVLGTPAYMSPEQRRGETADARSDQFAFCVALFEALTGRLPFGSDHDGPSTALRAIDAGEIAPWPTSRPAPARVRAALRRGLAAHADERFATMAPLLEALAPRTRRAWTIAAVSAALVAASATAVLAARPGPAATPPCRQLSSPFARLWDAAARQAVHVAFLASGSPLAEDAFARVTRGLDAYGRAWQVARQDSCEASLVRNEQSAAAMDLRMACLTDRLRDATALLEVLEHADADTVVAAPRAVGRLEPLAACADATQLAKVAPPPTRTAAAVAAVTAESARIIAITRTNHVIGVDVRALANVASAHLLAYPPLEARTLFDLGQAFIQVGQGEPARTAFVDGAHLADRAGDDERRARCWMEAVYVTGSILRKPEPALEYRQNALAVLERMQKPELLEEILADYTAGVYEGTARYDDALAEVARGLALHARRGAGEDQDYANLVTERGLVYGDMNHQEDALAAYSEARRVDEKLYGADHPRVAGDLSNQANVYARQADLEHALALFREALAIAEKSLGPEHAQTATYLNNMVNTLVRGDRYAEALPLAQRALAIRTKVLPADHPLLARTTVNLGMIYVGLGKHEEARALFRRGLEMQGRSLGPDHPDVAYVHEQLAELALEEKKWDEAFAEYSEELRIQEKVSGPESLNASSAVVGLAIVLVERGAYARALPWCERALRIAAKTDHAWVYAQGMYLRARASVALGGDLRKAREDVIAARARVAGKSGRLEVEMSEWLAKHGGAVPVAKAPK